MKNIYINYQNGVDSHIDLGASKFPSKDFHIGLVAYYYQQLTPDKDKLPALAGFKSRVEGIGPQIGYFFPIGDAQGYVNLKGYQEFAGQNHPAGWNTWLTFVISPKAPEAASPSVGRPPLGR